MAAHHMRRLGHPTAQETPIGADGGIDVLASDAIAQVKHRQGYTGRPDLQRLVGARGRNHNLELWFFSMSGYSRQAVQYASEMDIQLFTYDQLGTLSAHTPQTQANFDRASKRRKRWGTTGTPGETPPRKAPRAAPIAPKSERTPGKVAGILAAFFWLACASNALLLLSGTLRDPDWFVGVANLILAISLTALSERQRQNGHRGSRSSSGPSQSIIIVQDPPKIGR